MSNPQKPKPSSKLSQPTQPSLLKTQWGIKTEALLEKISEPLDVVGSRLMGDLWRTFYLTVQDAIALSLILQVPGIIGQVILGKSFSSFDICPLENALGVNRYACFIIVASNFLLWMILAGRILGRFWADLSELQNSKRRKGIGSKKP
jgi:hypothetical protein